ncbi:MAG TPA: helix-turn-helix domain-containing protein [Chloroflexota bacterium]|nr:helix-turn-helix domain-containing protein [Chloroflexota bacterium]
MALPTVETIQKQVLPPDSSLVAGSRGLHRLVTWPATLRTRAPGFHSLKGGEFLVISIENLKALDPSLSLLRLLQSVTRLKAAGAAVFRDPPADAISWAEQNDFPLFNLHTDPRQLDLETGIARLIAETRADFQQRIHLLYRQLTELAIQGRGLPVIVNELSRVTGKTAILLGRDFSPTFRSGPGEDSEYPVDLRKLATDVDHWIQRLPISASEPPAQFFEIDAERGTLIAPIMTRDGVGGYIAVIEREENLDELDRSAVSAAAAAGAIETARERAVIAAEERVQVGIVEELLIGTSQAVDALRMRAARLDLDLDVGHAVLATGLRNAGSSSVVVDALQREARSIFPTAQPGLIDGKLVLITTGADGQLASGAERLREAFGRRLGDLAVSLGVGSELAGLDGLRQSYQQAVDALNLGQAIFGEGRTVFYRDLGLYRLLLSIRNHPELEDFYQGTIGKLATYDAKSDGELLRTLDAYFSSHGSPTEAAERLHVHRNTLLYRLQRIRSIAGIDLEDPEVRLSLQLALRIRRIREATTDVLNGS